MTYFPVTYLRSVDLATPDITRSEAFYVATWGWMSRSEGIVYLRGTGLDHHLVALDRGRNPSSVTFQVDTPEAFSANSEIPG